MDGLSERQVPGFVEEVAGIGQHLRTRLQGPEYHAVIAVDVPEGEFDARLLPLSSAEHEGLRRHHHVMDRNRSLIARSTLRILLGTLIGVKPGDVDISRTANGKPFIASGPSLSISHSGALAVIALSGAADIGIDVEEIRRDDPVLPILAATLSPQEFSYISAQSDETLLLRAWTRKEAVAKLSGEGLFSEFKEIEVLKGGGHEFHCLLYHKQRDIEVYGTDLDIRPDYRSALASTTLISKVTIYHVSIPNL